MEQNKLTHLEDLFKEMNEKELEEVRKLSMDYSYKLRLKRVREDYENQIKTP